MNIIESIAATIVAGVLLAAAIGKSRSHAAVQATLPAWGLPALSMTVTLLVLLECACALLLVIIPPFGGYVALVCLAIFTVAMLRAARHGPNIPCPCFGAAETVVSFRLLLRNAVLMGLCVLAAGATVGLINGIVRFLGALVVAVVVNRLVKRREHLTQPSQ